MRCVPRFALNDLGFWNAVALRSVRSRASVTVMHGAETAWRNGPPRQGGHSRGEPTDRTAQTSAASVREARPSPSSSRRAAPRHFSRTRCV